MKTAKTFDCVQMKDEIQAGLRAEWQGLTEEEIRDKVQKHLATSDSDVAKWWRSIETQDPQS
jgi:hypothetical protein